MSPRSLGELLDQLESIGQLSRVSVEVSAEEEMAEITRRVAAADGPALLFEKVVGRSYPVVTNLLGLPQRICASLACDSIDVVAFRLVGESPDGASTWLQRLKAGFQPAADDAYAPRPVRTAACQQVVKPGRDVDLLELPAVRVGRADAATAITGAVVVTGDPSGTQRQIGVFDLPILDRNGLALHWSADQTIARHFHAFAAEGKKMPVAVVLGGPPSVALASYAAVPEGVDVYALAGLLADAAVELVTCRAHGLQVPAEAEFVLEGFVDRDQPPVPQLTMASPAGVYLRVKDAVRVEIVQITHRSTPLLPAVVHGRPPNETVQIVRAVDQVFLPLWQRTIPELVHFERPLYSGPRQFAVASIRKTYPHQARKVASALWGQAATMATRFLILVDQHVDVRDERDVWFQISAHVDPRQDVFFQQGPPDGEVKMAIDATSKLDGERAEGGAEECRVRAEDRQRVQDRWDEYGLS